MLTKAKMFLSFLTVFAIGVILLYANSQKNTIDHNTGKKCQEAAIRQDDTKGKKEENLKLIHFDKLMEAIQWERKHHLANENSSTAYRTKYLDQGHFEKLLDAIQWERKQHLANENSSTAYKTKYVDQGHFEKLMDAIQSERKYTLLRACEKWNENYQGLTDKPLSNALYSSHYKVAVCDIFKCGFSSWLQAVLVMEGLFSVEDYNNKKIHGGGVIILARKKTRFRSKMNETYAKVKWNTDTFRIITVRDPFSRLVSAYHDKMKTDSPGFTYVFEPLSRRINKQYRHLRHRPEDREVIGNGTATFEDFLNYLLEAKRKDVHWEFYNTKCHPCVHKYDHIMKFDTFQDDIRYLRTRLNISEEHNAAFFPQKNFKTNYHKVVEEFKSIPNELATKIYEHYKIDFELFGFAKPYWL